MDQAICIKFYNWNNKMFIEEQYTFFVSLAIF
jgi:hypothetical protein